MKKEILPQYVYRDKMGNSAALKEYYSLKFDNIDSCYEYIMMIHIFAMVMLGWVSWCVHSIIQEKKNTCKREALWRITK